MSEEGKNENENENGQDEGSMNIYDDNAYMFGDDPSGNNSDEQNEINDDNQLTQQNADKEELENEEINNMESKESYSNYYQKELNKNNEENNEQEIITNLNQKEKDNININNVISSNEEKKIENSKSNIPQKIQIENNNKLNDNLNKKENNDLNIIQSKKEQELKQLEKYYNQNEEYEENEPGEEAQEEEENGEMEEEIEGEGEGEEENIPLVTLKFISICQYCKNAFNSTIHLPYLLKCGHFFCLKCIKEHFTDEEGIKCPNDGLVALSIKELKILNNLITDKNIPSQRAKKENEIENDDNSNGIINNNSKLNENNTCKIHKGHKLTHIITETKQLVCVYCAFDIVRKNPKCEVKEIKEKFDEFVTEAEKVINLNQNNIKIIQDSLKDIKKNKENEEKNINLYFDHIFKYLNNKKAEYLSQIDSIFTDNAKKLSQKLEIFSEQIEQGESLKGLIDNYEQNNNFDEILDTYIKLQSIKLNDQDYQINLQEYKFSHDDETKIMKYINNFGDIKTINKYVPFQNGKKDAFSLKISPMPAPISNEPKKNYFNFNTNPILVNNNNKNSSRLTNNNSTDNQEILNEINYNNNNILNNKKNNYNNNYNFNFNKINPITNTNSNNSKRNASSKHNIASNNVFRNSEINNGNMNYINLDVDNRDKNYSFNHMNNMSNLNINSNKNLKVNRINNGDGRIYNNIYNINYSKRLGDKDISNKKSGNPNKNIKNNYENQAQNSLGYEYKGAFKTFNFK